jgi:hypothetical protein
MRSRDLNGLIPLLPLHPGGPSAITAAAGHSPTAGFECQCTENPNY